MSERAAARFDQQRIDMSVVTTVELDDFVAAGETAGQSKARHGSFGAAAHHPHFLDGRHPVADQLRHFHFQRIRNSKTHAAGGGLAHGIDNDPWRVTENRRPPAADVVDVFISIDISNLRAFYALDEKRCAADIAKRAHRGVYSAGNSLARSREKLR